MPMNAFLLQDIPADVAEYAARTARRARRGVNEVLVDMLARAIAVEEQAHAIDAVDQVGRVLPVEPVDPVESFDRIDPVESFDSVGAPDTVGSERPVPTAEPLAMDPESVALREAMLAAQSIPRG